MANLDASVAFSDDQVKGCRVDAFLASGLFIFE
jgi:hypothetical protein